MVMPRKRSDDEPVGTSEAAEGAYCLEEEARIETDEGTRQVEALKDELIGYIVNEIRTRYETPYKCAQELDLPHSYVNGLIHRNRPFSLHYLIQLANLFGIRVRMVCLLTRCS